MMISSLMLLFLKSWMISTVYMRNFCKTSDLALEWVYRYKPLWVDVCSTESPEKRSRMTISYKCKLRINSNMCRVFSSFCLSSMIPFKSIWKSWTSHNQNPPERNKQAMVTESLMLELEFHIKKLEQEKWEREQEERKKQTGTDYSWLIASHPKQTEIPQLERLNLEELCYRVWPYECSKIVSLFRDAMLRLPAIQEMPRIMKACILQIIEQRQREETFAEWMVRRTTSLSHLKLCSNSKIMPICPTEDVERNYYYSTHSVPDFRSRVNSLPV